MLATTWRQSTSTSPDPLSSCGGSAVGPPLPPGRVRVFIAGLSARVVRHILSCARRMKRCLTRGGVGDERFYPRARWLMI
jgi:hypothetical protein